MLTEYSDISVITFYSAINIVLLCMYSLYEQMVDNENISLINVFLSK